jgi:hypothetical protein
VIFFQFSEDGADNGFAEKFGLVGNFVFGTEMLDSLIFRIVKCHHFPVLTSCGAERISFVSRVFHKELISCCKVTKKNAIMQQWVLWRKSAKFVLLKIMNHL